MKSVIKLFSVLFLVGGVAFVSCKPDKKDPVKVTEVKLSKTTLSMAVGDKESLAATVIPDNADDKSVTWESNNEDVATVDNSGNVNAKGVGKAKITVKTKDGGLTATCDVTVELKMEENFEIEAVAKISTAATVFDLSQMTLNGVQGGAVIVFDSAQSFLSMPNDATLILAVKNTSGKVIPAGTAWKFRFKRNGSEITQVWVKQQDGSLSQQPLTTEGTLEKDLGINETFTLFSEPFRIHRIYLGDNWGTNSFCVDVLQFGKSAYPTASIKSNCYEYQIIGKK